MAQTRESGMASGGTSESGPSAQVLRDCHDILGAAAVIVVNLEFVSQDAQGDTLAALQDARGSVEKIVELANAIRRAYEGGAQPRRRGAGRRSGG
jgi:hypothetical protein